jgi:hypothetical protein
MKRLWRWLRRLFKLKPLKYAELRVKVEGSQDVPPNNPPRSIPGKDEK